MRGIIFMASMLGLLACSGYEFSLGSEYWYLPLLMFLFWCFFFAIA